MFFAFDPSNYDDIAAPVVFDYDGDGAGLVSHADSSASFDMNGDGVVDRTGWIEAGDALLALNRNNDGKITQISEISFVGDLAGGRRDQPRGLVAFDTNGDRVSEHARSALSRVGAVVRRDGAATACRRRTNCSASPTPASARSA